MSRRRSPVPPDVATLLTVDQVGTMMQISERAVRRIPMEQLPWVKIGRCRRYRRSDLEGFIAGLRPAPRE